MVICCVLLCINNRLKNIFKKLNWVKSVRILRNNLEQVSLRIKKLIFWFPLNVRIKNDLQFVICNYIFLTSSCLSATQSTYDIYKISEIEFHPHTELCMWAHTCLTFLSRLVSLCCGAGLAQASFHSYWILSHYPVPGTQKLWILHSPIVTLNLKQLCCLFSSE